MSLSLNPGGMVYGRANSRKKRILLVLIDLEQLLGVASCKCSAHLNCLRVVLVQLLDRSFQTTLWVSISKILSQCGAPVEEK